MTQAGYSVGAVGGEGRLPREESGAGNDRPPTECVYDNEQITPGPLRAREEQEERRRFVEGLRRLRVGGSPAAVEN